MISPIGFTGTAIQDAINTANAHMAGDVMSHGSVYLASVPEVFIPAGIYTLDKPLVIGKYTRIRGEDAILQPSKLFPSGAYAITGLAWRCSFTGLQFNGINGFDLNNQNLGDGEILIDRCAFHGGAEAIRLNCRSTATTIRNCNFDFCVSVLTILSGDVVSLEGGWIVQPIFDKPQQASITVCAFADSPQTLTLSDVCGNPNFVTPTATETAWINNYGGTVICDNCRFGGEAGGKTVVNNFRRAENTYPVHDQAIIIQNSRVYCIDQLGGQSCAVRLFEVPNQIHVQRNAGLIAAAPIAWSKSVNPTKAIADATVGGLPNLIRICIDGNQASQCVGPLVPDELKPFSEN